MKILCRILLYLMTLKDFPAYGTNPFTKLGIQSLSYIAGMTEHLVSDIDTGEYFAMRKFNGKQQVKMIDKRNFRKVYVDALDILQDLPRPALKVFCYVMYRLRPDENVIDLDVIPVMEWCKFKDKKQYYAGVCMLINMQILARSNKPCKYYINTNIVFNGDRTTKD